MMTFSFFTIFLISTFFRTMALACLTLPFQRTATAVHLWWYSYFQATRSYSCTLRHKTKYRISCEQKKSLSIFGFVNILIFVHVLTKIKLNTFRKV